MNKDNENRIPSDEEIESLVNEAVTEVEDKIGSINTSAASARERSGWPEKVLPRVNKEDGTKLGRNDPCLCGSGKKYKKCCGELLNG